MSKLETVKSLSAQRSKAISEQINELRTLQTQSVENLAQQIEPLAQALAALSDEARTMIEEIVKTSVSQQKDARQKWREAAGSIETERKALVEATAQITSSTDQAARQLRGVTARVWIAAIMTGVLTAAVLLIAYTIWQPPLSEEEKLAVKGYHTLNQESKELILEYGREQTR